MRKGAASVDPFLQTAEKLLDIGRKKADPVFGDDHRRGELATIHYAPERSGAERSGVGQISVTIDLFRHAALLSCGVMR